MTVGKVRNPWAEIIFSIITLGIYWLYWNYATFSEIKKFNDSGIGGGLGLVLAIFLGFLNWFLLPSGIKAMYETQGEEAPVSGIWGLINLIPLIGFIIWTIKVQGAMNNMWKSKS